MMVFKDGVYIYQYDFWLLNDYFFEVLILYNLRFCVYFMFVLGLVVLIMNDYGDMFMRFWDYDIVGIDFVQFCYIWQDQSNFFSFFMWLQGKVDFCYVVIKFLLVGWKYQLKIFGEIIDRFIVVLIVFGFQNWEFCVEGCCEGYIGYWFKMIDVKVWKFVFIGQNFKGKFFDNLQCDMLKVDFGFVSGFNYLGNLQGKVNINIKDFVY